MSEEKRVTAFTARILKLEITPHSHAWRPPTDLFETETEFIVRVEIAGLSENDFSVNYDRNMLVVLGKRSTLDSKCAYHRMEIPYGEFSTRIPLPEEADIRRASAEYENGFLTIRVPRSKPVNIKISSEEES
ncbi:MAG: Hsp20/alpha crystallin family protein [Pelolinea sp.]|nr:Hsp20/alpha crystallin family protein [Pelolinea sp.]